MAKIFGVVTNEQKKPVEFATVFKSDANGKPIGNVATTGDDKGRWTLDGLLPTDYVTARMVGLEPSTMAVSKAVKLPDIITGIPMTVLNIPMKQSASNVLQEVVVTAEKPPKPTPTPTTPPPTPTPTPTPPKKGMSKALKIGLIVGGVLLVGGIIAFVVYKNKKGKK